MLRRGWDTLGKAAVCVLHRQADPAEGMIGLCEFEIPNVAASLACFANCSLRIRSEAAQALSLPAAQAFDRLLTSGAGAVRAVWFAQAESRQTATVRIVVRIAPLVPMLLPDRPFSRS
ncbi:MAG: hypothetical protein AAGK37_06395 [Pseudomonadota bacterium]